MKRMTRPLKSMLVAQTLALAVVGFGLTASAAEYTLESDETWTAEDLATKMTGVINLNGHTLTVSNLQGNATITDKSNVKYELLDAVTSSTWNGQRIDSKVKIGSGFTVKADFEITSTTSADRFLLGSCESDSPTGRIYPIAYNTKSQFYIGYGDVVSGPSQAYALNTRYRVESFIGATEQILKVDGVQWLRTEGNPPPTATYNAYIFARNIAGTLSDSCSIKLYGMTILNGDAVLREFVPARRLSDGEVGLLDLAHLGKEDENNPEFYTCTYNRATLTAGAVTGYVCTDAKPGELHVVVAEGETVVNETVALAGGLKLVKDGAGTFVAAKSGQTYAGGTEVTAGTFQVAAADESANRFVGASGSSITVDAGATLDVNGNPDFTTHPITLAGGTVKNGANTTSASVGAVTLTADSTIHAGGGITQTANVALGGKALAVSGFASDNACYQLAEGVSYVGPGAVSVSGGILSFDGTAARNMRTVDLTIASAVNLFAPVTVSNLTSTYTGTAGTEGTSTAKFLVTGTYTASTFHRGCEMQDGSTLDLSALAGPVSNVTFAAGSAITVALGTRTLAVGDEVVSWAAESKPSETVTFETELEGSYGNKAFEVREDGLYLAEADVAKATWKGVNPQNVNDPANWLCASDRGVALEGRIPSSNTVVTLPTGCTNSFPVGGAFQAREVKLPATLGADNLDWRGITAPFSGTLDLQGRKLTVSRLAGTATITDKSNVKYELLEHVGSTTWCGQYIDSGVKGKPGLTVKADFLISQTSSTTRWLVGSRETSSSGRFMPIGYNTTATSPTFFIGYGNGSVVFSTKTYETNTRYNVESFIGATEQTLTVNGEQWVKTTVNQPPTATNSLYIFNLNTAGSAGSSCSVNLYGMTILDGDTVLREFVPAKRVSGGMVGLLDLAHFGSAATESEPEFYETKWGVRSTAGYSMLTAGAVTGYVCTDATDAKPGELHVVVAEGETVVNETVALAGGLKLVKDGAGTFVAAKSGQTYAGGTEVAAGTFQVAADDESVNRFAGTARSAVTVDAGATLDVNGNPGFEAHPLVLAGGTVMSSGTNSALVESAKLGDVTLTADSIVSPDQHIRCLGLVDLGTHTLTLTIGDGKYFEMMAGSAFTNGLVNATTGGYIFFAGAAARDMGTVDLWINCGTKVEGDITVRDLTLGWAGSNATACAYGDGSILINRTFTPQFATGYHRNCVMQDGSTLNLAEQAEVWPLEPGDPLPDYTQMCNALAFAENAETIHVTLGDRRPKSGPIVTWQTENAPGEDVTFVLESGVNARLVRKTGGLWLQTGFLIRIR